MPSSILRPLAAGLALSLLASPAALLAWLPGTGDPDAVQGFTVTSTDRTDVLAFYNTVYAASEDFAANMAWTGNIATGVAGTTSAAFKDDVRRRINFYRALVGLPTDITFDSSKSAKDQAAALMFSANADLNHTPPTTWTWYTATGAEAAGNSNIAIGNYGPDAIDAYIYDSGSNNAAVGHRRWLLYPLAQSMGTGDVPPSGSSYMSANACWVVGDFKRSAPAAFVAWPNRGYCPFYLRPARWSLTYPGANFTAATVTLSQGGTNIPVTIVSNSDTGIGYNTIVWAPQSLPTSITADIPYSVFVSGISGAGVPTSYSYNVTLFDPGVLGASVTIAGSASPATTGEAYTFNPITQADAYQLRVATASTAGWAEGAEDATAGFIQSATTGGYALRSTAYKHTGAKAFHLTFPDWNYQSFTVLRDLIPTASSQLQFYDRGLFATTTTTLSAEVSTDNGNTWTSVWSRPGVGLSSANWDPAFVARTVSLATYTGQTIRVRFILRYDTSGAVLNTANNCGFYIDDITVTNATQLAVTTTTTLSGGATGFTLDATTAGAALAAGNTYYLRIRPQVGTRWFGDGPIKIVTATTPATGYAAWAAAQSPAITGGPQADQDNDGLNNGLEYAFGLDPLHATPNAAPPVPELTGNSLECTYTQPTGVSGITYGGQWSTDLVNWTALPDTGSGTTHTFNVSTTGLTRCFFRHVVTVAP
ncbi:MAG: hypothetical protein IPL39_18445 [Opitutaceae bacterium]|nr:hypothetical protein [Opitutaceae bacterium]